MSAGVNTLSHDLMCVTSGHSWRVWSKLQWIGGQPTQWRSCFTCEQMEARVVEGPWNKQKASTGGQE